MAFRRETGFRRAGALFAVFLRAGAFLPAGLRALVFRAVFLRDVFFLPPFAAGFDPLGDGTCARARELPIQPTSIASLFAGSSERVR